MRVSLRDSVFDVDTWWSVWPFWNYAVSGRHRVFVSDSTAPLYVQWRASTPLEARNAWDDTLNLCVTQEAIEPSHHAIEVARRLDSAWSHVPEPQLTVEHALDLLDRPYRVLVENGHGDRDFLFAVATQEQRDFLREWAQRDWLEFEHGGGIGHLTKRVEERRRPPHVTRTSALFDSDADRPGNPSANSTIADGACGDLHHLMLRCRAIENYLPIAALERWARGSRPRELWVRAVRRLSVDQRRHFHFKRGLPASSAQLFAVVHAPDRALLMGGVKDIAELFARNVRGSDYSLPQERADLQEVRGFLDELVARVR